MNYGIHRDFCRRWSFVLAAWIGAGVLCALLCGRAVGGDAGPERDLAWFVLSDIHLGVDHPNEKPPVTPEQAARRVQSAIEQMRGLVSKPFGGAAPAEMHEGVIPVPRGMFILGDLTDGHKDMAKRREQWKTFEALFPVNGVQFGKEVSPVFASLGNHDGEAGGPQGQGLIQYHRALQAAGHFAAMSENGLHYAINWQGIHFIGVNLCPADAVDEQTPFRFGKPGKGSWNDPQGALTFLGDYLKQHVGKSGQPVFILQHYGFDSFSLNDWNWWTPRQRRAFYDLIKDYNIAAILHGHNHHAEHYRWPDPKIHAADMAAMFGSTPPAQLRQYDVISCGPVCWVFRVKGSRLMAGHFKGSGWSSNRGDFMVKSLEAAPTPQSACPPCGVSEPSSAESAAAPGATAVAADRSATIRVNLREEKAPVPAGIYGIFMEEISHAFDGGIYGELIRNRSFENGLLPPGMKLVKNDDGSMRMELEKLPPGVPQSKWNMPWPWNGNCRWDPNRELEGWSMRCEDAATGRMQLTSANPMNAASARSLEMTVNCSAQPQSRVLLVNSGYWGMKIEKGDAYDLTFWLRPGTFSGEVSAMLISAAGKPLGSCDLGRVTAGDTWQKHAAVLNAAGTDAKGQFALVFKGTGTLQVDWVSLFGPGWRGRRGGLRRDLAKYLEELKPNFIRYPGGCYAEGLSFESAPDWRAMVCPPEERPGQWGYWQYRSTDGFGYHEFLQFCEDIGADAMYVSFAGMTVHPENNWPVDRLEPVIDRTLGAIEYAIGAVDSRWGAVRAKMGHPKPFPLKYVEIGNEHPPEIYGDYYAKFRGAIKARYPQITVVMSMYWSGLNHGAIRRAGDANIDMVDEHAYRPAGWARTNFDYFDRYPRKPWKIYIGEYAHHHGSGDWSAAMDDSVFLMMMERNGDLVKLASYAPLFANLNKRDWGVNLIEFDASRSFAHASYYVQKTFNENRPDVNLATQTSVKPEPDPNQPLMAGKFGLGSWNTRTEFKELRMYDQAGQLVFSDDFAGLDNWEKPTVGQWRAKDGVLTQTDVHASPSMILLKGRNFEQGRVTLKARRVGGSEGFLIFFNAGGIERFLFCNYGAAGNAFSAIQDRGQPAGCSFNTGLSTPGPIAMNRWYEIRLDLSRDKAVMFLDGKRVSDATARRLPDFFATAGYRAAGNEVIIKATNFSPLPLKTEIQLDGAASIGGTGLHVVISSANIEDENTLDEPRRIVPRETPLAGCASHFPVTLPAYSVNVLCVPARR